MTLRIRSAVLADIPAVRDLLVRTWHNTYDDVYGVEKVTAITKQWHSVDNLQRQLVQPLSVFLVAEIEGNIVATAKARTHGANSAMLDRLYVDPAWQRSGIGFQLLEAAIAAFPLAASMRLEVEPKNVRALAFYRKHGFATDGKTPNCGDSTGIEADQMIKPLRTARVDVEPVVMRPVRDADAQDLIGLITLCFVEYPGCYFDPHDDMPDIVRPTQSRLATEGQFLAVEDATGRVCACVGVDFPEADVAELHRLYVRLDMRGMGLAKELTRRMENIARERGASRMVMWSDTRFNKAHRLYEGLGYARSEMTRSLGDISKSREFFFEKRL